MQSLALSASRSFLLASSSPPRPLVLLFLRSSFSSSSSFRPDHARQQIFDDEESKGIKVSVWWDYENCSIPSGVHANRVATRIVSALRSHGIRGPVSINAFGDVFYMPRATQEAFISTGICITHVPQSGKNSADRLLMAELISWTTHNPPPAHFFLISSDKDFSTVLHRLRMNNYNILLSSVDSRNKGSSLYSAATLMWPWIPLVKGEDFTPRQFNHPPDGVYGSWYGHLKGSLDDPFEEEPIDRPVEMKTCTIPDRPVEMKTRTIPKSVVNAMRHILLSYPEGMALSQLRDELYRRKILNNDLFGYRKFSNFINSMPYFTLIPPPVGERQRYVVLTRKRPAKLVDEPIEPPCVQESAEPAELEQVSIEPEETVKPSQEKSSETAQMETVKPSEEKSSETVQMIELPTESVEPVEPSLKLDTEKTDQVDDLNNGIFGRFRKIFFGNGKNSEKAVPVVKCEDDSSTPLPVSVPVAKDKLAENSQEGAPKEELALSNRSLFKRMGRWFGFGRKERGSNLFSDNKVWSDVESFLISPEGSDLVAKSKTREELMQGLQKAGILSLKSLEEADLIHLIDLLISEKKWIQESTSCTFPFTLSIPSASTQSSIIPEYLPESITNPDQLPTTNPPPKEEVKNITNSDQLPIRKPPSKEEVLSDCHKLVKEMLDEQPKGFDMGLFKPRFESKFGYMLEYRKIGHSKLASVLQTIPGIKIDFNNHTHATRVYKCDENEKKIEADDIEEDEADSNEEDSVFDELGPVSKEIDDGYHEPSLSDEEFSEESETEENPEFNRETSKGHSSLIKILDTFAGSKDGDAMRKEPLEYSRRYDNNKREIGLRDEFGKRRSLRSQNGMYKFVSDETEDKKEKIVDSILGTLKKNGDSTAMVEGKGI